MGIRFLRPRPNILRYFLVVLAFALGLMAKSTLVTWPFLFLLLDYWPLRRPFDWRLLLEKAPLLMAVAGCATVMFLMQRAGAGVSSLASVSIPTRLLRAMLLYVSYLRISFWPVDLSLYAVPKVGNYWWALAAGGLLVVLTLGAIWAARRGQRWLPVGWFWFLGTFVPTIGLVQVGTQVLADRFLYLPQIGLWIAVVWTAARNGDISDSPKRPEGCFARIRDVPVSVPLRNGISAVVAALVLALFTVAAWRQTACWQNTDTLWAQALACDEQNPFAHVCLGMALHEQHRDDLAEANFREALCADPESSMAYCGLGWLMEEKGDLDGAIQYFSEALARNSNLPDAEFNLGNILLKKGDLRGAESHLTRAIELRGDFAPARVSLAQLRQRQGADDEAVELCREALEIDPTLADAQLVLAGAAARRGDNADVAEHLRMAVKINPHLPDDYVTMADAYSEAGRFPDAVRAATTAHDLAAAAGQSDVAADVQRRLDSYRAGKAFHSGNGGGNGSGK